MQTLRGDPLAANERSPAVRRFPHFADTIPHPSPEQTSVYANDPRALGVRLLFASRYVALGDPAREDTRDVVQGPPFEFARSMSLAADDFKSPVVVQVWRISSSVTGPERPSEQRRYVSPTRGCSKRVSTFTRCPHAERAHDHVLVREVRDLLGGEPLHLDVIVQERVVFGQLLDLLVAAPGRSESRPRARCNTPSSTANIVDRSVPIPRCRGSRCALS